MTLPSQLCKALATGAALIALAALAQTATAQVTAQVTAEQQSAIRANCRSDFMSKCSGVTPGGKDALLCLQKNVASLAPGCKTAVSATIPAPAPAPAPAAPTPARVAATPPPAPPSVAAPSQPTIRPAVPPPATVSRPAPPKPPQAAKPSAPQQAAAAPPSAVPPPPAAEAPPAPTPQQLRALKFTCSRDFKQRCRGIAPGGPEALACLQRNAAKLTPDCKTTLADIGDAVPVAVAAPPPPTTQRPNAPIVMTAVIGRACLRDLVRRCRGTGIGDGEKIACLLAHGPSLAPLCKAALKITAPVR
jgi:hypothetical protein